MNYKIIILSFLFIISCTVSDTKPTIEILDIKTNISRNVLDNNKNLMWNKPLKIKSREDASKYFDQDKLLKLSKIVDYENQFILIFNWSGSGGDKLNYTYNEDNSQELIFSLARGRTRDLRIHQKVFVLDSGATLKFDSK